MNLSVKERLRAEWNKIQSMKGAEKREYIWGYYKFHILGTLVVFFMVGSIINDTIINPPPDPVITIAWMGLGTEEHFSALRERLYPVLVQNPSRETVHITSFFVSEDPQHAMAQNQRLSAMVTAQIIDLAIGPYNPSEELEDDRIRPATIGMAPAWMFGEFRPTLAQLGIDAEGMVFYEDDGDEIGFAIPVSSAPLFQELNINIHDYYIAMIVNTQRHDEIIKVLEVLWGLHD